MKKQPQYNGETTKNGYVDTTEAPLFTSFKEMRRVMQDLIAPQPRPREIQHVVLDADDTIWRIAPWNLASLIKPVGRTDGNILPTEVQIDELVDIPAYWLDISPHGEIELDETLRDTLEELKGRGIAVSLATMNNKKAVVELLDAFGLTDEFMDVEAGWSPSKGDMVRKIAERHGVDTAKILFVDDSLQNAMDVSSKTNATSLIMGYNITKLSDIMEFIQ